MLELELPVHGVDRANLLAVDVSMGVGLSPSGSSLGAGEGGLVLAPSASSRGTVESLVSWHLVSKLSSYQTMYSF